MRLRRDRPLRRGSDSTLPLGRLHRDDTVVRRELRIRMDFAEKTNCSTSFINRSVQPVWSRLANQKFDIRFPPLVNQVHARIQLTARPTSLIDARLVIFPVIILFLIVAATGGDFTDGSIDDWIWFKRWFEKLALVLPFESRDRRCHGRRTTDSCVAVDHQGDDMIPVMGHEVQDVMGMVVMKQLIPRDILGNIGKGQLQEPDPIIDGNDGKVPFRIGDADARPIVWAVKLFRVDSVQNNDFTCHNRLPEVGEKQNIDSGGFPAQPRSRRVFRRS